MIKPIQYMRGIASLLVVFAHYPLPYLENFSGAFGVDIFFVISGFIIALSIGKYEERPDKFIINRLFRIYPVWLVLSVVAFGFFMVFSPFEKAQYIERLLLSPLFIGNTSSSYSEPIIFSGWSLRYEVFFYLLAYVLLKITGAVSKTKTSTMTTMLVLGGLGLFIDSANVHVDFLFSSFFLYFGAGIFLFSKYDGLMKFGEENRVIAKAGLILSIILLVVVSLFKDQGYEFVGNAKEFIFISTDSVVRRFVVWGIPSILFFVFFLISVKRDSPLLFFLGKISYSLYLIHSMIKPFVSSNKLLNLLPFDSKAPIYIITIIISIILSYYSQKYLEQNFSNYLRKKFLKLFKME